MSTTMTGKQPNMTVPLFTAKYNAKSILETQWERYLAPLFILCVYLSVPSSGQEIDPYRYRGARRVARFGESPGEHQNGLSTTVK
jgi:hypothetical protein